MAKNSAPQTWMCTPWSHLGTLLQCRLAPQSPGWAWECASLMRSQRMSVLLALDPTLNTKSLKCSRFAFTACTIHLLWDQPTLIGVNVSTTFPLLKTVSGKETWKWGEETVRSEECRDVLTVSEDYFHFPDLPVASWEPWDRSCRGHFNPSRELALLFSKLTTSTQSNRISESSLGRESSFHELRSTATEG